MRLPAGTGSGVFRAAISEHWLPALERFAPDFLFISAGFDAHLLDDMSGLALTEADYASITRELMDIADGYGQGRVLSTLEGRYEPGPLPRGVIAHIKALLG